MPTRTKPRASSVRCLLTPFRPPLPVPPGLLIDFCLEELTLLNRIPYTQPCRGRLLWHRAYKRPVVLNTETTAARAIAHMQPSSSSVASGSVGCGAVIVRVRPEGERLRAELPKIRRFCHSAHTASPFERLWGMQRL
jgi:hypothetical protein